MSIQQLIHSSSMIEWNSRTGIKNPFHFLHIGNNCNNNLQTIKGRPTVLLLKPLALVFLNNRV